MDINIESQIVVQTAADWAADTDVYSELRILITSDVFYSGTDQRKFKIANGVDTWSNLDYLPITSQSLSQVLTEGNTTSGNNIELTLLDLIKSAAANKSQIDFGTNGDEVIVSTDAGGLAEAWINFTNLLAKIGFNTSFIEIDGDKITLNPNSSGLGNPPVVLAKNLLTSNAENEAQLLFGSHSAALTTDGGANAETGLLLGLDSFSLFCLANGLSMTTANASLIHDTLLIFNSPQYQFNGLTASRLALIDASNNLISADTATYPSLIELAYLKGVNASLQTQLNRIPFWICGHSSFSPLDSTTYAIGCFQGITPQATGGGAGSSWKFPYSKTITKIVVVCRYGTAGSNESSVLTLRDVTGATDISIGNIDYSLVSYVGAAAFVQEFNVSISVNTTSFYFLKEVMPAFATNPVSVGKTIYFY